MNTAIKTEPQKKPGQIKKLGLCVYHADCNDGFAAALAVWLQHGDSYMYKPAHYGDTPSDYAGRDVIIVDFSYKRKELEKINEKASSLIVIDHHKSAQNELEGLDYCLFDMEQCGAVLTYQYLFRMDFLPMLFKYIQDRDLWQWELPNSRQISAGLQVIDRTFVEWKKYLDDDYLISKLLPKGEVISKYQKNCIDKALAREWDTISLAGYTVPCLNTTHLVSEIVGKMAKEAPFAVGYFDLPGKRVYSLRSTKESGVDVSEIASIYGGGGHRHAAGFSLPLL